MEESIKYWEQQGHYYGYPECCIKFFLQRAISIITEGTTPSLSDKQKEVISGCNGFIPCPECANKVTPDTLSTLIKDRECPSAYPKDDMDAYMENRRKMKRTR